MTEVRRSKLTAVAGLVTVLCTAVLGGLAWVPTTMTTASRSLGWVEHACTFNDGEHWVLPRATVGTFHDSHFVQPCIVRGHRAVDVSEFEGHGLRQLAWQPDAGVVVAVADLEVESAGPTLEFFISLDQGEHWRVHSFIKPSYEVSVDDVSIDWPNISIRMGLDSPTFVAAPWQRWFDTLRGDTGPAGTYVARSTDGAKSFTLRRPWW